MLLKSLAAGAAGFLLLISANAAASPVKGTWALTESDKAGKVHLSFNRTSGKHRNWQTGKSFDLAEFPELDLTNRARQPLTFTLKRDAGDISGDGVVLDGAGSGVFTFSPASDYLDRLKRLGFADAEADKQWAYALNDVSLAYARGMAERKIPGLEADELLGYRAVGGDLQFVDDLRKEGLAVEDAGSLIAFRVHDVTSDFVRAIRATGLTPDEDELVAMQIHDVTPAYIAEMKASGLASDVDDLIAFQIHDVTPAFAKSISDLGFDVSGDDLTALRIHDVTPELIQKVRAEFGPVDLDEIVAANIHDVTPDFIDGIRTLGLDPSLEQLVAMRIHGVTPAYIRRLRDKGVETRDIDKLVSLKIHGID